MTGTFLKWFALLVAAIVFVGCVKKEVSASRNYDEVYTRYTKRGVNFKTETRTRSGKLLRIHFNSDAGTVDSIYMEDSTGVLKFEGVHRNTYNDTLYIFDTITGLMKYRCYFRQDVPVRTIRYWPNGNIRNDFRIDKIEEVDMPMDSVTYVIEIRKYASGHMKEYSEAGLLVSEGPIERDEHAGVWVYYRESGEIDHRDTLK